MNQFMGESIFRHSGGESPKVIHAPPADVKLNQLESIEQFDPAYWYSILLGCVLGSHVFSCCKLKCISHLEIINLLLLLLLLLLLFYIIELLLLFINLLTYLIISSQSGELKARFKVNDKNSIYFGFLISSSPGKPLDTLEELLTVS